MAEQTELTPEEYRALNAEDRGKVLATYLYTSQMMPGAMKPEDYYMLGLALDDKEAVGLMDQFSREANIGFDFAEAATYEAVFTSWQAYDKLHPESGNDAARYMREGIADSGAVSLGRLAPKALVGGVGGPVLVSGAWLGGLFGATHAGPALGAAKAWAASTPAAQAIAAASEMAAPGMGVSSDLLIKANYLLGPGRLYQILSAAPSIIARGTYRIGAGAFVVHTVGDVLDATMRSVADLRATEEARSEVVRLADLEKMGYEVSRDGVVIAAGENDLLALGDETITIRDPEGNLVTAEDVAEQLNQQEIPDPFAEGSTTSTTAPAVVPVTGDQEPYGIADQYRTSDPLAPTDIRSMVKEELGNIRGGAAELTGLDKLRARWKAEADAKAANPLIGVPEGYNRVTDPTLKDDLSKMKNVGTFLSMFGDNATMMDVMSGSEYRASDPHKELSRMTGQQLIEFQERAIDAGLIDPKSTTAGYFRIGQLEGQTFSAMTSAMAQANVTGNAQDYWEAMDDMIAARQEYEEKFGTEAAPTWTPPRAYFAPDYATISQNVKSVFRGQLGRDPNGWEMDLLADQFRSDHRAAYDAEMAGSRAQFEAEGRAQESGIPETPVVGEAIDPVARMAENFETTFSDEMDAKSRWADVKSKGRNLFGSLNKLGGA